VVEIYLIGGRGGGLAYKRPVRIQPGKSSKKRG
jgi:hypothetical protein